MKPNEFIQKIIEEQGQIVGRKLAHSRALGTGTIKFASDTSDEIDLVTEPKQTLESLLFSYGEIFGQASVDVCLNVIRKMPYEEIEQYLPETVKTQVQSKK